jgi:hypothetical protein
MSISSSLSAPLHSLPVSLPNILPSLLVIAANPQSLDCFMANFGPEPHKKHGYPGHPEIELSILRLYRVTKNPKHLEFARYLLSERGVTRSDLGDTRYFIWEAKERGDDGVPETMDRLDDTA